MPQGISVKRLNSFLVYPYLVLGWGEFAGTRYPAYMRTYSIYQMVSPSLVDLLPLPPDFIENKTMKFDGGEHKTRSLYQLYCQSGDFLSPFDKGCVKVIRELYPMLMELGAFKPEWEESQEFMKPDKYSTAYLRDLGECAYDMLSPEYSVKRGKNIMANPRGGSTVIQSGDIKGGESETTKSSRQPSKAYQLYNSLKSEEPNPESVHNFYWLLGQHFGSLDRAIEVLQNYDKHISAHKFTVGSKMLTLQEKASLSRDIGYSDDEIQRVLEQDILTARDSYSLPEKAEK